MTAPYPAQVPLAAHCLFLRGAVRAEPALMRASVCVHPIRDGEDCVGPFLQDVATSCGLWEQDAVSTMASDRRAREERRSQLPSLNKRRAGHPPARQ